MISRASDQGNPSQASPAALCWWATWIEHDPAVKVQCSPSWRPSEPWPTGQSWKIWRVILIEHATLPCEGSAAAELTPVCRCCDSLVIMA